MSDRIDLPGEFLGRMRELLGAEYDDFLASYEEKRYYGLRCNPLKTSEKEFPVRMPFALDVVRWAREGYYYQEEEQPGRHVLHEAGVYYIQEPSAMAVVEILDPQPGERILDLCAAPGGKSTQIAGRMNGEGLLVSNEIVPNRARILSQNVERMGIRNCVVCNETPERMAAFFTAFFDRIVVDAPCSGEGMFRKDDTAVAEWSVEHVSMCADRQNGILEEAAKMLKPGGVLVYSTCTFAPLENEAVISRFVREHEAFAIERVPHDNAFAPGRPDWIEQPVKGIEYTMRLMPHKLKGEGHYIARLRRKGVQSDAQTVMQCPGGNVVKDEDLSVGTWRIPEPQGSRKSIGVFEGKSDRKNRRARGTAENNEKRIQHFLAKELGLDADWLERQGGSLEWFGEQIYLVPDSMISMSGMKVVRPGLHIGTDKQKRIEPSHALALALTIKETDRTMELTREDAERYLHGESVSCTTQSGWTLLTYEGYPLGFGKAVNGQMKNHYPKGLRR